MPPSEVVDALQVEVPNAEEEVVLRIPEIFPSEVVAAGALPNTLPGSVAGMPPKKLLAGVVEVVPRMVLDAVDVALNILSELPNNPPEVVAGIPAVVCTFSNNSPVVVCEP